MRLREIRRTKNMSGVKVAKYLGISPQYYYDLERGERNLSSELAVKLSELFNSTIDYLLGITENNLYSLSLYSNGGYKMLSESAQEKLSRYQYVLMERDAKLKEDDNKKDEIILLYAPPLNMLARGFADQVLEDEVKEDTP